MRVVTQKQFSDRVVGLVRNLAEALREAESSRSELTRIFNDGWVATLEDTLAEQRYVCEDCEEDYSAGDMGSEGRCYRCEAMQRTTGLITSLSSTKA